MYDVALPARACLRAGTQVTLAWAVETAGLPAGDAADAVLLTPGGGRIGSLLRGAADSQLSATPPGATGRLVTVEISDLEAQAAGLASGGTARCLVVPGDQLPAELWDLLDTRQPVCLVSRLAGREVVETRLLEAADIGSAGEAAERLWSRGVSGAIATDDAVVTVFCPVPKLVLVGGGPIVGALAAQARLLGWSVAVGTDAGTATGLIAGLSALDRVVVAAHDIEVAGAALEAALATDVGYLAALGSRSMAQQRADWLTMHGISDQSRVHTPAGLDLGASSPAEIAVAIAAEALAVRAGTLGSLGRA
jgi:xanthine dehydrogenase accessory factor